MEVQVHVRRVEDAHRVLGRDAEALALERARQRAPLSPVAAPDPEPEVEEGAEDDPPVAIAGTHEGDRRTPGRALLCIEHERPVDGGIGGAREKCPDRYFDFAANMLRRQLSQHLADDFLQINEPLLQGLTTEACERQQVINQPAHVLGVVGHLAQVSLSLIR